VVLRALNSGAARIDTSRPSDPFGGINGLNGHSQWIADDSLDSGSVDLDKVTVTVRDGGGGQFVWIPDETSSSTLNDGRKFDHAQPQKPTGVTGGAKGIDPCAKFLPANIPSDVSIDENMKLAAEQKEAALSRTNGEDGGDNTFGLLRWFEGQMATGGSFDYNKRDTKETYDDLGNFNYAAMGSALGLSQDQLLRVAGWKRQNGGSHPELGEGTPPATRYQAVLGYGGTYPFGDKRKSSIQIMRGVLYYDCRRDQGSIR